VKRVPVDFRYDAVNPDFLLALAKIGSYASEKYGSWSQYTGARLLGDKDPVNHIYEHLRQYQMNEGYDHFDGDVRWHLVAVAYNAMMSFWYHSKWGALRHPLDLKEDSKSAFRTGEVRSVPGIRIYEFPGEKKPSKKK
jgi:hypothetical protein